MSAELAAEGPVRDPETLPRLLAALWAREWSGFVAVKAGDVERRLYLTDGRVQTATSNDPSESLTALLVDQGVLGSDDVGRAAQHLGAADRGLAFVRRLVKLGLVDEATVESAERSRVVGLAERVLALRSGLYRCEVGAPPAEMVPQALEVPQLVATGVLGRWDETWAMNVLGGMGAVLRMRAEGLPAHEATGADEAYDLTLLRCDGRRRLAAVLEASPLPELAAVRFLAACRLLDSLEAVEAPRPAPAPPPEPVAALEPATAAEAVADEDAAEAGQSTAPGYYRPSAGAAPAPRRVGPEPPAARSPGGGRWLWIALLIALAGAVAWFGWVGLQAMGDPERRPAGRAGPAEP